MKPRTARERELRRAVTFMNRLTTLKTNGGHGIVGFGAGLNQYPREHFLDYCERILRAFPRGHKLPTARLRKGRAFTRRG